MSSNPLTSVLHSLQSRNLYILSQAFNHYGAIALFVIDTIWELFLCRRCVIHLLDMNASSRLVGEESIKTREEKLAWYTVGGTKSACVEYNRLNKALIH